jgi:hypothetical protein
MGASGMLWWLFGGCSDQASNGESRVREFGGIIHGDDTSYGIREVFFLLLGFAHVGWYLLAARVCNNGHHGQLITIGHGCIFCCLQELKFTRNFLVKQILVWLSILDIQELGE